MTRTLPASGSLFSLNPESYFAHRLGFIPGASRVMFAGLLPPSKSHTRWFRDPITARTAGNKVVEKAVLQCRAAVTEGRTLAEPLRSSGVFPPMVTQMISVGEQTGALDAMLSKIADFYDDEVDTAVSTLTSLLEPIMIFFLGVVVGGLVVAMYLPIFKLVTLVK